VRFDEKGHSDTNSKKEGKQMKESVSKKYLQKEEDDIVSYDDFEFVLVDVVVRVC